jgi:multimeric flavodoxin WrbA
MKATILNGALSGDDFVDAAGAALHDALWAAGWDVTTWTLRDEKVAYCLGCFECWTKTPGLCRIDDAGRDVAASLIGGDLTVYLTAVTFGGYSSALKGAVDRSICLVSPFFTRIDGEVHHQARYERYPALAAVGVLPAPHPAQEQLFHTLVGRNAINLHASQHSSAVVYRTQPPAGAAEALAGIYAFEGKVLA